MSPAHAHLPIRLVSLPTGRPPELRGAEERPASYVLFAAGMVGVISGDLKDRKARRATTN